MYKLKLIVLASKQRRGISFNVFYIMYIEKWHFILVIKQKIKTKIFPSIGQEQGESLLNLFYVETSLISSVEMINQGKK